MLCKNNICFGARIMKLRAMSSSKIWLVCIRAPGMNVSYAMLVGRNLGRIYTK